MLGLKIEVTTYAQLGAVLFQPQPPEQPHSLSYTMKVSVILSSCLLKGTKLEVSVIKIYRCIRNGCSKFEALTGNHCYLNYTEYVVMMR